MGYASGDKPGTAPGNQLAKAGNLKIMKDSEIVEVQCDQYARKLVLKDTFGKVNEYPADGMFLEKAPSPLTNMVAGLVDLDTQGRIAIESAFRSNVPALFAAGDMTNRYSKQVLAAVGEGV